MQPNSEPTPADIAAVAAFNNGQPAPAPQPTPAPTPAPQPAPQMQPTDPTPQPAPSQQPTDPFASLFASEPAAPTTPTEPATPPTQPTEPTTPQPSQPTEPTQPTPQVQPAPAATATEAQASEYETYDQWEARVLGNIPDQVTQPDPEKVDPNDPAAIKGFFDDLVTTAVEKASSQMTKKAAIQTAEKQAWDSAFEVYPSLQKNKELRDTVHNIRIANFQRGIVMTPVQAAESLLKSMGHERRAGAADAAVVTTYEEVQPNGGGSGTPVPTDLDAKQTLTQVQDGGEAALAQILDKEIKAGRTW